jgi:hypothetical protein
VDVQSPPTLALASSTALPTFGFAVGVHVAIAVTALAMEPPVLDPSDALKVGRIHARGVLARVVNDVGDRADKQLVSRAMSSDVAGAASSSTEDPVALPVDRATPQPALIGSSPINLRPEPIFKRHDVHPRNQGTKPRPSQIRAATNQKTVTEPCPNATIIASPRS